VRFRAREFEIIKIGSEIKFVRQRKQRERCRKRSEGCASSELGLRVVATARFGSDVETVVFNDEERIYLQGVIGIQVCAASCFEFSFTLSNRSVSLFLDCPIHQLPRLDPVVLRDFEKRLATLTPTLYKPYRNEVLVSTAWNAYDAMRAFAVALSNLTAEGKPYTGDALRSFIQSGHFGTHCCRCLSDLI
jgi:hypothetical protein